MADGSAGIPVAQPIPASVPWPPNYVEVFVKRAERLKLLRANKVGALEYYRTRPIEFIEHWGVTYDPRNAGSKDPNKIATMPFIMFPRQKDLVLFLLAMLENQTDGLAEKCRDMGATWVCVAFSVWLWIFWPGASIGWGSRKQELVDRIGDADSIFEKIRIFIRNLPREFYPKGFDPNNDMPHMKIINPDPASGSSITGEVGDNIGRGGRKLIYFKDESAHYERPELIEASLGDNTNCQIDISSVNGLGNVFYRRRKAGKVWEPGDPVADDCANIFVMRWQDHPAKTQEWYDRRRRKAESEGLLHKFAQEVDRNYASAVTGVIIQQHWIQAAIGADRKLGIVQQARSGPWRAALDVADNDGKGDRNAQALAKGIVLTKVEDWSEVDTGATTRRALGNCLALGHVEMQYDCIGMGSGVKAEFNRLRSEGLLQNPGLSMVPWDAGAAPLRPKARVVPGDTESPLNGDFYQNLKAQGWWQLARKFENTWRAVNEPDFTWTVDDLIVIDESIPPGILAQIEEELCQPTYGRSATMKVMVNKTPEGTRSPNVGDAIMMLFWPVVKAVMPEAAFGVYGTA